MSQENTNQNIVQQENDAIIQQPEETINTQEDSTVATDDHIEIRIYGRKLKVKNTPLIQKKKWPDFKVGDTIRVHYLIKEGDKERIQYYEGTVMRLRGEDLNKTFTVRRISHGIGVERTFPYHSPWIADIEIIKKGRVRRARLYYLRDRVGKSAKIQESF